MPTPRTNAALAAAVGTALADLRATAGLSLRQVAARTGLAHLTVRNAELAANMPTIETVTLIARACGGSVAAIGALIDALPDEDELAAPSPQGAEPARGLRVPGVASADAGAAAGGLGGGCG